MSWQRWPWCKYSQIKKTLSFNLRYLSELCCLDGPLGAGQATFPVVSALLSANCNMSSITAVFSLSDGMSAQCRVALLRVLNCYPTCTMKHRITAAMRTTQSCCRCWRAAVNLTHGESACSSYWKKITSTKNTFLLQWFDDEFFPEDCVLLLLLCFILGLCLTGCIVAYFVMFMENSWSRSMRSTSASEVRQHTHTHTHTYCSTNTLVSVSRFWKWKVCQTDCLEGGKKIDFITAFIARLDLSLCL